GEVVWRTVISGERRFAGGVRWNRYPLWGSKARLWRMRCSDARIPQALLEQSRECRLQAMQCRRRGRVAAQEREIGEIEARADRRADIGELAERLGCLPPVRAHRVARRER